MTNNTEFRTSVWTAGVTAPSFPSLSSDATADVVIVGGGITGLTAAWILANARKKVILLEAHKIGLGATAFSTGNLYEIVGELLYSVKKKHNLEAVKQVIASRRAAMNFIQSQVNSHHIRCDFEWVDWNYFTTAFSEKKLSETSETIENEYATATDAGLEASKDIPPYFPFKNVSNLVQIPNQAQINPYKYILGLAEAIDKSYCGIFENTSATKIEDGDVCTVHTKTGKITASHVIVATHTPKGIYEVQTEMQVYREFAVAARIDGPMPRHAIYWNLTDTAKFSVRPYSNEKGDFLIATGDPFLTGTPDDTDTYLDSVVNYLKSRFQVKEIVYQWAAQNYKPADALPYIGTSLTQKNTFIATGFQADGLVYGTLASMIICDKILGRQNVWEKLYSPTRFTPLASAKQFIKENVTVAKYLLKDHLFYGEVDEVKEIKPGEGKTVKIEGEKIAAYRDSNGKLHLVSAICPHLNCVVHFNNTEKTWDCPCHGSRFTISGEFIEGPALHNLSKPKD